MNFYLKESRAKLARKMLNSTTGRWITVRGRPIFIRIKPGHIARIAAKKKKVPLTPERREVWDAIGDPKKWRKVTDK